MNLPWRSVRWLQRLVHLWLFGYLLSSLPAAEWLWTDPAVPSLPAPPGVAAMLTHAFSTWAPPGTAIIAVVLVMVLALRSVFLPSRWYITLVEWGLFNGLVNYAWLDSTGGHQLIANVLFWMILLPAREPGESARRHPEDVMHRVAFWVIRLQLLLVYAVTGLEKLMGAYWPSGEAVGIIATDTRYGPAWLAAVPLLATTVNYAVLLFQLTFPVAVWWRRTRPWWMAMGILFHLSTGLTFGILDMGLAFLAVYPIWFRDGEMGPPVHARSEGR